MGVLRRKAVVVEVTVKKLVSWLGYQIERENFSPCGFGQS